MYQEGKSAKIGYAYGDRKVAIIGAGYVGLRTGGIQQRIRERWSPEEYRGFFDAVEKVRAIVHTLEE